MDENCPHCKQSFLDKPDRCPHCGKALFRICGVCGKTDVLRAEWYQSKKTDNIVCGRCYRKFHGKNGPSHTLDFGYTKEFSKEMFESSDETNLPKWTYIMALLGLPILLALLLYVYIVESVQSMINDVNPSFLSGGSLVGFDISGIVGILLILAIIFMVLPLIFNSILLHIATIILRFKIRSIGKAFLATLIATFIGFLIGSFFTTVFGPFGFIFIIFLYLVVIKHYYKCDYLEAFLAWLMSTALVYGVIFIVLIILLNGFGLFI